TMSTTAPEAAPGAAAAAVAAVAAVAADAPAVSQSGQAFRSCWSCRVLSGGGLLLSAAYVFSAARKVMRCARRRPHLHGHGGAAHLRREFGGVGGCYHRRPGGKSAEEDVRGVKCVDAAALGSGLLFAPLSEPLHVAARKGLTVVVQELLGKGASVLAVDENGYTPSSVLRSQP
ncbi:hypothetical protein L3Q82_014922, partial [Scortum barcoo]